MIDKNSLSVGDIVTKRIYDGDNDPFADIAGHELRVEKVLTLDNEDKKYSYEYVVFDMDDKSDIGDNFMFEDLKVVKTINKNRGADGDNVTSPTLEFNEEMKGGNK